MPVDATPKQDESTTKPVDIIDEILFEKDESEVKPGDTVKVTFSCKREYTSAARDQFVQKDCEYIYTLKPGGPPVKLSFNGCVGQRGSAQKKVIEGMIKEASSTIHFLGGDNFYAGTGMSAGKEIQPEDRKIINTFYTKMYESLDTPIKAAHGNHDGGGFFSHGSDCREGKMIGDIPILFPSGDKDRERAATRTRKVCQVVTEEETVLQGKYSGLKKFHQPAPYYKTSIKMSDTTDDNSFIDVFVLNSNSFMLDKEQKEWFKEQYSKSKAKHKLIISHHAPLTPGARTFTLDERKKYDLLDYPEPTNVHNEILNWMMENKFRLGESVYCSAHDHFCAFMDTESSKPQYSIRQVIMNGGSTNNNARFSAFPFLRYVEHGKRAYGAAYFEFDSEKLKITLKKYLAGEAGEELAKFSYKKEEGGVYEADPTNSLWITEALVKQAQPKGFLRELCMMLETGNLSWLKWILLQNMAEKSSEEVEGFDDEFEDEIRAFQEQHDDVGMQLSEGEEEEELPQTTKQRLQEQKDRAISAAVTRDAEVIKYLLIQVEENFAEFDRKTLEEKKQVLSDFHETLTEIMLTDFLKPGVKVTALFNQLGMLEYTLKAYKKLYLDKRHDASVDDDLAGGAASLRSQQLYDVCGLGSPATPSSTMVDALPSSYKRTMIATFAFEYVKEGICNLPYKVVGFDEKKHVGFDNFSETEKIIVAELLCLLKNKSLSHPEYVLKRFFMVAGEKGNLKLLWECVKGKLSNNVARNLFSPDISLDDLRDSLDPDLYNKIKNNPKTITVEENIRVQSLYTELLSDYITNQPDFPSLLLTKSAAEKIMKGKDGVYESIYTELDAVLQEECKYALSGESIQQDKSGPQCTIM
jgi:hypothetical protein